MLLKTDLTPLICIISGQSKVIHGIHYSKNLNVFALKIGHRKTHNQIIDIIAQSIMHTIQRNNRGIYTDIHASHGPIYYR